MIGLRRFPRELQLVFSILHAPERRVTQPSEILLSMNYLQKLHEAGGVTRDLQHCPERRERIEQRLCILESIVSDSIHL